MIKMIIKTAEGYTSCDFNEMLNGYSTIINGKREKIKFNEFNLHISKNIKAMFYKFNDVEGNEDQDKLKKLFEEGSKSTTYLDKQKINFIERLTN